jgi:hypothetical protein
MVVHPADRERIAPPGARYLVTAAEVTAEIARRQVLAIEHGLLQQPVAVQRIQKRDIGRTVDLAGREVLDSELGGARKGRQPLGQQRVDGRIPSRGEIVHRRGQTGVARAAAGKYAVEVPVRLEKAALEESTPCVVEGYIDIDAVLITGTVDALG